MYEGMLHLHSGLRWVALILLVYAVVKAYTSWRAGKNYGPKSKLVNLLTMVSFHLMATIGLILFFVSPKVKFAGMMKNDVLRFFTLEHGLLMIAAVVLLTIGRKKAEQSSSGKARHRKIFTFYLIALILVLVAIPWPFRANLGSGWF
jgi:hypothetical protein